MMILRILTACCFLFLAFSAQAADMYRWVDEKGKTHFSDTVPEKYKKSATRMDSRQYELSESQLREKAEQAAKVQVPAVTRQPPGGQESGNPVSIGKPQSAGDARSQTDCAALRKQYLESQDCFGRYRNVNGSVRAEAFQHCTVIEDPTAKCGPLVTERY